MVEGEELQQLHLLSLELEGKVPIVVVENNLANHSLIGRDNKASSKATNLLYTVLSNTIQESIGLESNNNYKNFLFYNDSVHFNVLMELIAKYQEDFISQNKEEGKN